MGMVEPQNVAFECTQTKVQPNVSIYICTKIFFCFQVVSRNIEICNEESNIAVKQFPFFLKTHGGIDSKR
jgi:hypothetical protein